MAFFIKMYCMVAFKDAWYVLDCMLPLHVYWVTTCATITYFCNNFKTFKGVMVLTAILTKMSHKYVIMPLNMWSFTWKYCFKVWEPFYSKVMLTFHATWLLSYVVISVDRLYVIAMLCVWCCLQLFDLFMCCWNVTQFSPFLLFSLPVKTADDHLLSSWPCQFSTHPQKRLLLCTAPVKLA